jgi:trehalose 6-phosphate phosphatase
VLHRLAQGYGVVAVVSGRRAAFLAGALGIGDRRSPLEAYGLYGAEHVDAAGHVTLDPAAARWRPRIEEAVREMRAALPTRVAVEAKDVSAAVHWRLSPSEEEIAVEAARAAARRHGLVLHLGRMSAELLAPDAVDKGVVVSALAARSSAACFVGDDVGDLPAFAALGQLSDRDGTRVVRVAVASDESPRALLDAADVLLDSPATVLAFLEALSRAL